MDVKKKKYHGGYATYKQSTRQVKSPNIRIYLDGFIIIHNPPFMIMTVCKTKIMLPIIANLQKKKLCEVKKQTVE